MRPGWGYFQDDPGRGYIQGKDTSRARIHPGKGYMQEK